MASTPEHPPGELTVVGIGASAGGLRALEALASQLDLAAIGCVVLQHLAPTHESALTEILERHARLPVVTATDGMPVRGGVIHVLPAGVDGTLHDGALRLTPLDRADGGARHGIDRLFRSLAAELGPRAIGVVLSGAGTDGTLGLRAIREAGGLTFAQEPSTAEHASMPESAIDDGCVDVALEPAEIGEALTRLEARGAPPPDRPVEIERGPWAALLALLRDTYGVDFDLYKQSTLERRVHRRMLLVRAEDLRAYIAHVREKPDELEALYSDLLISVTRFFRDHEPFELLASTALPKLLTARPSNEPLRAWVAGCATGEEAYSLAILFLELLGGQSSSRRVQIFATDVDARALTVARRAEYPPSIALDVSPDRLARFFNRTDKGYRLRKHVRELVVFARHDVTADPPYSRIDLVTCRNVLIYMQPPLQARVLRALHYALRPGGFLLLGTSESVSDSADLFALVDRKQKLYVKQTRAAPVSFDYGGVRARRATPPSAPESPPLDVLRLADRKVIERYGPPGVVVDERLHVLQFRGRTGRYLEPTPGFATLHLLKLARPELLVELRPAVQRALTENVSVITPAVRLRQGDETTAVRLDVSPLPDVGAGRGLLILFNEEASTSAAELEPERIDDAGVRVTELERELGATKEYLQATVEELETSNEELQSANEELQSANEELQSANEELETSREELQSANEELVTLNDELRSRLGQLHEADEDLQTLLRSTASAVVLVGQDLRIRRFSASAERLLELVPSDVGRSVEVLRSAVRARDLAATVAESVAHLLPHEQRVLGLDGRWFRLRIVPHRSTEEDLVGALLELAPVGAEVVEPRAIEARVASDVALTLRRPLAVLDRKLQLTWGNPAFLMLLGLDPDVLGRPIEDLWANAGGSEEW